jgi:hypothetical protein
MKLDPKVRHFSNNLLTEARLLNSEEKEKFFKEAMQGWSERKKKL